MWAGRRYPAGTSSSRAGQLGFGFPSSGVGISPARRKVAHRGFEGNVMSVGLLHNSVVGVLTNLSFTARLQTVSPCISVSASHNVYKQVFANSAHRMFYDPDPHNLNIAFARCRLRAVATVQMH